MTAAWLMLYAAYWKNTQQILANLNASKYSICQHLLAFEALENQIQANASKCKNENFTQKKTK